MTAKEWLRLMQQAADYNPKMTKLIEKYGEMLMNEEVERRIKERLPSEEDVMFEAKKRFTTGTGFLEGAKYQGFIRCSKWLRSRLTVNKQEGERECPSRQSKDGKHQPASYDPEGNYCGYCGMWLGEQEGGEG